jgi:hypothetical protein
LFRALLEVGPTDTASPTLSRFGEPCLNLFTTIRELRFKLNLRREALMWVVTEADLARARRDAQFRHEMLTHSLEGSSPP